MKFSYLAVVVIQACTCLAASRESTVVCKTCPTTTANTQVVTRTSRPTAPCSAPALTAIYGSRISGSHSGSPTSNPSSNAMPPPITNGGGKSVGRLSGAALVVAFAAVYAL